MLVMRVCDATSRTGNQVVIAGWMPGRWMIERVGGKESQGSGNEELPSVMCGERRRVSMSRVCQWNLLSFWGVSRKGRNCLAHVSAEKGLTGCKKLGIFRARQRVLSKESWLMETASSLLMSVDVPPSWIKVPKMFCGDERSLKSERKFGRQWA